MKLSNQFPVNASMQAWQPSDHINSEVVIELQARFGSESFVVQPTRTGIPVV